MHGPKGQAAIYGHVMACPFIGVHYGMFTPMTSDHN